MLATEQPSFSGRFEIFQILQALPREQTVDRLNDAARSPDAERREAALRALTWIGAN